MFIPEGPIDDIEDDILGRKSFSVHLSGALKSWTEKDSLVIAIYGEWGSGKTSLVNMATGIIQKTADGPEKPGVVRFNPWVYSESRDILTSFISEIVKNIKKDKRPSKRLIKNLEYYLGMISIAPTQAEQQSGLNAVITILAFLGISFGQIVANSTIALSALMTWAGIVGLGYLLINAALKKLLSFLKLSEAYHTKTVDEVKSDICSELSARNKKLLIVIDDIDRLTTEEMRSIFRIIRTNADFPNTIYLLSFDRNVVEKNLSIQAGVSGRDYLEKIVQVSFDVPKISEDKVAKYLLKELDHVLQSLPKSATRFFEKSEVHWANVFNSGFRYYFSNLRDVKRYIGSVGFNISQMFIGGEMEVNPIDFFAIELIRIFEPEFYRFILNNKSLFTSIGDDGASREEKKKVVQESFALAGSPNNLRELVFTLFPQVKGFADGFGNTHYDSGWQSTWTKELRICSHRFFNAYFNYIPAGDEMELSQYELALIRESSTNFESFSNVLSELRDSGKIEKFLDVVQSYTDDPGFFLKSNFKLIILALFEAMATLPKVETGFFGIGLDIQVIRIVYQLLKRNPDLEENFRLLSEVANEANYFYGPVYFLSIELQKSEKTEESVPELIPSSRVADVRALALGIVKRNKDKILDSAEMLPLLYRWLQWDGEDSVKSFLNERLTFDKVFLDFLSRFVYEQKSQSIGDRGYRKIERFNYKSLKDFIELEECKTRLENLMTTPLWDQVDDNIRHMGQLFMKNYQNRDKDWMFMDD